MEESNQKQICALKLVRKQLTVELRTAPGENQRTQIEASITDIDQRITELKQEKTQ